MNDEQNPSEEQVTEPSDVNQETTPQISQNPPINEEALRKERQKIAKDVQELLTKKLERHEIEPEVAKEIALKVVEELRGAKTHFELESLIPHLSEEFAELKDILKVEIVHQREELDRLISKIVLELIKHEQFQKAIEVAKLAKIEKNTLQDLDEAKRKVNAFVDASGIPEPESAQTQVSTPQPAVQPAPIPTPEPPPQPAVQPAPIPTPEPPPQPAVQPAPAPAPPATQPAVQPTPAPAPPATQPAPPSIPTEGSTADSFPETPEFSQKPQNDTQTQEEPSLTERIQEGIGKIAPVAKEIAEKAKDVATKAQEAMHKGDN